MTATASLIPLLISLLSGPISIFDIAVPLAILVCGFPAAMATIIFVLISMNSSKMTQAEENAARLERRIIEFAEQE